MATATTPLSFASEGDNPLALPRTRATRIVETLLIKYLDFTCTCVRDADIARNDVWLAYPTYHSSGAVGPKELAFSTRGLFRVLDGHGPCDPSSARGVYRLVLGNTQRTWPPGLDTARA